MNIKRKQKPGYLKKKTKAKNYHLIYGKKDNNATNENILM